MRDPRRILGDEGENEAAAYLQQKGFTILGRNVRLSCGELDLVAEDHGVLVFVEVKRRRSDALGSAAEAVDSRKQTQLVRLAALYLAQHRIRGKPCRFDVVLFDGDDPGSRKLQHLTNAFDVMGDDLRW